MNTDIIEWLTDNWDKKDYGFSILGAEGAVELRYYSKLNILEIGSVGSHEGYCVAIEDLQHIISLEVCL